MDISKLLTFSVKEGASDCHISSGEPPMIRIHGDLKKLDHPPLTPDETHALIYDMMTDTQRKNFEEHRECDFSFELGDIARFRVNVFVQQRGLGAVFRNIPTEILPLEKLGMPPILRNLCDKEKGLILVTGPTGSGKSTTLAAMVDYLNNTFEGHIITIEDPIEFVHRSKKCLVNQRELGVHTLSFANALKSALREDPDIVLVGEMRDLDTIQLALTAAEAITMPDSPCSFHYLPSLNLTLASFALPKLPLPLGTLLPHPRVCYLCQPWWACSHACDNRGLVLLKSSSQLNGNHVPVCLMHPCGDARQAVSLIK